MHLSVPGTVQLIEINWMNPYLVPFHVAWILSKTNWMEIKTRMGFFRGVGHNMGHCVHIQCVGVREKITERLIAGTLEARHHLLFTVYYLRQSVGSRNADRGIPRDKLTHFHNRAKKVNTTLHVKRVHTYTCNRARNRTRDGKLLILLCITRTKQNTLKFQTISRELHHHPYTYTRHIHACTLLRHCPTHLEMRACGTNYAKNA